MVDMKVQWFESVSSFQLDEGSQLLLSACLSCDGCLSEEDNLKISQQNLEEVERVLALNKVCSTRSCMRNLRPPVSCCTSGQSLTLALFFRSCQRCDASKHKVLVASLCPQSLPFFAVKFGLGINEAAQKLCSFLKHAGELTGLLM